MTADMTMALSERDILRGIFGRRSSSALSDRDIEPVRANVVRRPDRRDALVAMRRLRDLQSYGPNWDSQGARPIDPTIIGIVQSFITQLAETWEESDLPTVVPTVVGGVSVEWRNTRGEFSLEFEPSSAFEPAMPKVYYWNAASGEEWERDLREVAPSEIRASVSKVVFDD